MLKTAVAEIWAPKETKVHIPREFFANNPLLEGIQISGSPVVISESTFQHLEKLETLRLEEGWGGTKHEVALSEKSPLYNKIKYGNENASGYEVVNTRD